jgi:DNA-binding MarR family transcriptional regulator
VAPASVSFAKNNIPLDAPERRRLPLLLRRAWFSLNQAFRRRIAHLGITPDQFTALRTLLENDGISQTQLTRLMASDPNTIASLVERMEANGLVERKRQETDRRAHCLRLRPAGREKYEAARRVAIDLQGAILRVLPESQREKFLTQLAKIADSCQIACAESPRPSSGTESPP